MKTINYYSSRVIFRPFSMTVIVSNTMTFALTNVLINEIIKFFSVITDEDMIVN